MMHKNGWRVVLSFIFLLCVASTASAGINDGLIAYYPLDGTANEATGRYVDGTLRGNATFGNGVIGQALYLDGNGDYVDIGNGLNLYEYYSVSFWIKTEDLNRRYPAVLAKYETNQYGPYDFDLHYNKVNIWVSNGSGSSSSLDSTSSIQQNEWTHVVYAGALRSVKIFINGQLDNTVTAPLMTQNNDRVTIGRQALMFQPYSNLEFKGFIDDLRVYDRTLSDTEVRELYQQGVLTYVCFRHPLDSTGWYLSQAFGVWNSRWDGYHLGEDYIINDYSEMPVYATADGIVKHVNTHTGYGYVVIIEHDLGNNNYVCSVYGHLRQNGLIGLGDSLNISVKNGQQIGYLSSNSNENGGYNFTHLHFGIRSGTYSTALDPDGRWRYRGYGSTTAIRDLWYDPSNYVATNSCKMNDTAEFVKQQYRDFLNREAETGGLQYWVNIINSGAMTRAQVIDSFFWSEEFGGRIAPIVRLYFAYFLRIPDYGGLMYWIDQFSNGQSLGAISDAFAASSEFQQTYGSLSKEAFVNLVYQNILGRAPDPGGYAFWLGELNSGRRTRGQVMIGFSESAEYKGLTSHEVYVTMMYVGMLRRSPEQEGFNFWVDYLDSGNSGLALIDGFLYSQEYANRFQ